MENTYSQIQELLHRKADFQARLNLIPYDGNPEIKEKDGQNNVDHIAEEIADVLITIDQMIIYHDIYDVVAQYREQKLERLRHKVFMEQYG